ncbi:MAG: serine hydrolase, partial [Lachnospiraceae bacterium]|nr:serine hydrolase [Lachnospiraceae bacterium]
MEMINNLRDTIRGYIDRQEIAGVSVLVQKKGEEICFLAEGMSDIENGRKIERDTIYRLYSQTKPVTAAAVMILVERGILDLCQPVSDFLPGFKNQKVLENGVLRPVHREAALFDLMQMTAGSTYTDTTEVGKLTGRLFDEVEKRLYGDNPMTTIEFANAVGELPLAFDPGSSWNYGLSADILGAVVEIASGMRLGDFMQKEIFEPLGMKDTAFWVPEEKQHRLAKSYDVIEDETGKHLIPYTGNEDGIQNRMERRPAYESGGAGLASTLDDYMRFARMLLNGG